MLVVKKIDVFGQMACFGLMVLFIINAGSSLWHLDSSTFLTGYFILAGWQLTSIFLHWSLFKNQLLSKQRAKYEWVLLSIIPLVAISFVHYLAILAMAYLLLVITPILAIWYIKLSYKELQIWQARDFIHLK